MNWINSLQFYLFSLVAIVKIIKKKRETKPQNTEAKKIVETINKKISRFVILLKNNGLSKN